MVKRNWPHDEALIIFEPWFHRLWSIVFIRKIKGSYELSNSNDYGESIAMKFKLNITKTGLPDGDIIVGDWYEGILNTLISPILNWNPLMTLMTSNGERTSIYRFFFHTRL